MECRRQKLLMKDDKQTGKAAHTNNYLKWIFRFEEGVRYIIIKNWKMSLNICESVQNEQRGGNVHSYVDQTQFMKSADCMEWV